MRDQNMTSKPTSKGCPHKQHVCCWATPTKLLLGPGSTAGPMDWRPWTCKYNKQPISCEAQLAAQLSKHFSTLTYIPSKLGQTALVFRLWSQFISRSTPAKITTQCVQWLWFAPPWLTHRHTNRQSLSFWLVILLAQLPRWAKKVKKPKHNHTP